MNFKMIIGKNDSIAKIFFVLLLFFCPFMFFNPMTSVFAPFQLFDVIFITFVILLFFLFRSMSPIPREILIILFFMGFFICLNTFGIFMTTNDVGLHRETIKLVYCFLILILVAYFTYAKYEEYFFITVVQSYFVLFGAGILGIVFSIFGIESTLTERSPIIQHAIRIENLEIMVPRVLSFMKPTANMFGAYLALVSLPILHFAFSKNYIKISKSFRTVIILFLGILLFLTFSRVFVIFPIIVWAGVKYGKWDLLFSSIIEKIGVMVSILTFAFMQVFTIWYPIKFNLSYSNDPNHTKPVIDLVTKTIENPIYFVQDGIGSYILKLNFEFAYNHYYWLKSCSHLVFWENPLLGVGFRGGTLYFDKISSEEPICASLMDYINSQSQYFTLLSEHGLIGSLTLIIIFWLIFLTIYKQLSGYKSILIVALVSMALVILDLDILTFRWTWVYLGLLYGFCLRRSHNANPTS